MESVRTFVKFCLKFQTKSELVFCFCCVADCNVPAINQTRPEMWGALSWSLIFVTRDPILVFLTYQEPGWQCPLVFQSLECLTQGRLIGSVSAGEGSSDTAKSGDVIFNFRFVTQWLLYLNILYVFLCSAQLFTQDSLWGKTTAVNVDERVAFCMCL